MISIENGKDNGYSSNSTIIKVMHTINHTDLEQLVRLAKQTMDPDRFNAAAGITAQPAGLRGPYFCTVEGTLLGSWGHGTRDGAVVEAQRLAGKHNKKVTVSCVVASVDVKCVPETIVSYR